MKSLLAIVAVAILTMAVYVKLAGDTESPESTTTPKTQPVDPDSPAADITAVNDAAPVPSSDAEQLAVECDLKQLEALQQFNRTNMHRLENSRLEPEAIAAYRSMPLDDLKALFEQDDSLAMIVYGMHFLFGAMGRNPGIAVDYLYYQMPIKEITPNPAGVPEDAARYAKEARRAFTQAAMRGRHAAFTFIGLTYVAEGKNAVDLFWLTEEAFDSLTEEQRFNVEPRIAYSHLAYRMDPNLLPIGSPNRKMFDDNLAILGKHGRFLDFLELQFRAQLKSADLTFPTLPEVLYPDVDPAVIEQCKEQGYSEWD